MKHSLEVLYEDNHILAVNKPANLLTQPSGTDQESLEEIAKLWIKEKYQKPGNVYLHAVHRLDKAASGIVIFAKTSKALSRLQEASRKNQFEKIYVAEVSPPPAKKEGVFEHYLVHADYCAKVVDEHHPKAKLCRLTYRVLSKKDHKAVVEIQLETGRYHQIRAQFAAIGSPVVGDVKYGSQESYPNGIALHHKKSVFPHPITKTSCMISSNITF